MRPPWGAWTGRPAQGRELRREGPRGRLQAADSVPSGLTWAPGEGAGDVRDPNQV